jgi:class 3 adenylate cyclase
LLAAYHSQASAEIARFSGKVIDTAGDGVFAIFDGPARAIRCSHAIRDAVRRFGLAIRAGLHTGECEMVGDKVMGLAVHIAARIAGMAESDEVLVSSTVRDLVAGSGLRFEDRGSEVLKGVPGEWRLFTAHVA